MAIEARPVERGGVGRCGRSQHDLVRLRVRLRVRFRARIGVRVRVRIRVGARVRDQW